jgi:hypothetical protein
MGLDGEKREHVREFHVRDFRTLIGPKNAKLEWPNSKFEVHSPWHVQRHYGDPNRLPIVRSSLTEIAFTERFRRKLTLHAV